VEIDPARVSIIMISESAPPNPADFYYAPGNPFFAQTTLQMFRDAGEDASTIADLLEKGVYLTTAVKCGKIGYNLQTETIQTCAKILAKELALFPQVKAYLLMGDVAIKAMNAVAKHAGLPRVVPAGPTYKIRKGAYFYQNSRVFPSYLQVGPSFFIEKGKHQVVAEDIKAALAWSRQ
jgi:uracil-DNA glycosylase